MSELGQTPAPINPLYTYNDVVEKVSGLTLGRKSSQFYWAMLGLSFALFTLMLFIIIYLFLKGVGIWGIQIPVAWGFAITNFVWWVGIGHAGTFISAILFLFRQDWRNSINRFAEAMTLFAVACAALFPILHLGRPDLFYWLLPYPDTFSLSPQYKSPLVWDAFAITTYGTVSLLFWYMGLVPDLAIYRERTTGKWSRYFYGILSLGWRNDCAHWKAYESVYLLLAGLATPLVISVHSIVSMDFANAVLPGWHSTIYPPYFVAGAIFSGFAMVLVLAVPMRKILKIEGLITEKHLDYCTRLLLVSALIVAYSYIMETFMAWYSEEAAEWAVYLDRMVGNKAIWYWPMVFINVVLPQLFWFKKVRTHGPSIFCISLLIVFSMWIERFVIVVTSLQHDFLPSSWETFHSTIWDWGLLLGTIGFFSFMFLLFLRILPIISITEVELLVHKNKELGHGPQ